MPQTGEQKRARRATANRILNILKGLTKKAFHDGLVDNDTAWRQVKPFTRVDEPRIRFLTDEEAIRLIAACRSDLRLLVRAALLTGARVSELTTLRCHDVHPANVQIYVAQSKSGRPRFVPLNAERAALCCELLADKTSDDLVLTKQDGKPWGNNHHARAVLEACKAARIRPAISFHELRHTYASHLAQAGVDLLTISKLLSYAGTRIASRHYAHLADTTLAQAVTRLPSFRGGLVDKHVTAIHRARYMARPRWMRH
ncbi:MAG TPA: site-specific integrase [Burkholderiales bacterium]|nr:site-specific integrase [Burkholderiales bacterium]